MTEEETPIRVVLIDDDALVRAGLKMLLGGPSGISVVGEADDGSHAQDLMARHRPDVVLMDIRMPRVDGLTATRALLRDDPDVKVLVLTTFDADDLVVQALQSGARGFVLKDTAPERLIAAVRDVAAGDHTLSPTVTSMLIKHLESARGTNRRDTARQALEALTDREWEVARLVAEGLANADIADQLYLSVPTIKAHMSNIRTKTGMDNRVQLALLVHDAGMEE